MSAGAFRLFFDKPGCETRFVHQWPEPREEGKVRRVVRFRSRLYSKLKKMVMERKAIAHARREKLVYIVAGMGQARLVVRRKSSHSRPVRKMSAKNSKGDEDGGHVVTII